MFIGVTVDPEDDIERFLYIFNDKAGVCSNQENIHRQLMMERTRKDEKMNFTYHSSRSQSLNPLAKGLLAIFN